MNNTISNELITKVDTISYNLSVSTNAILFLVAFIVVLVVCFILYKSIDNFISF